MPVTGLNRPNTGKEDDGDRSVLYSVKMPAFKQCMYVCLHYLLFLDIMYIIPEITKTL
jgi:hypothetical protein